MRSKESGTHARKASARSQTHDYFRKLYASEPQDERTRFQHLAPLWGNAWGLRLTPQHGYPNGFNRLMN